MKTLFISLVGLTVVMASNELALEEFTNANNLFAKSLYKEIVKTNTNNFLVSPYSAALALAFVHSGCRGDTAREIRNTLYFPDDHNRIEAGVKESLPVLTGNDLYTLHTANKLYAKQGFSIRDSFIKSATETYGADIETIDFTNNVKAAKTMNTWVKEKTNNKIQNLIDPNILDENTRTILINALYFKANWSKQFGESQTTKREFYKTTKDVTMIDMMHQYLRWYRYYESPQLNAKFLELPFKGEDVSMVIVLPNEKEGLTLLENQIDKVLSPQNLQMEYVNIVLPKFKIESTIQFTDILKNLGIKKAFDGKFADLSGIAGKPGDLEINDVVQKTFLNVAEGGVEVAAATYVSVAVPVSAILQEPKNFVVDHPFIFYIRAKGFIIFAGRILLPNY